jgi:hypothetical protein
VAETETTNGRPDLTVEVILVWADAHCLAHGTWPEAGLRASSGVVEGVPGESWNGINQALALGLRGLPGDSSLAELLAEQRGAPVPDLGPKALAEKIWAWEQEQFPLKGPRRPDRLRESTPRPRLTLEQVLGWADAHHAATGKWPTAKSGPVLGAPRENWANLNNLLRFCLRGLPSGLGIPRMLEKYRGVGDRRKMEPLSIDAILAWADAHHEATGTWPKKGPHRVRAAPFDVTWEGINSSLIFGRRGLPGGSSLFRLLAEHRGVGLERRLDLARILAWADAHHAATGTWPTAGSGPVLGVHGEDWKTLDAALKRGNRGLPGRQTLHRLLARHRGVRKASGRPPLCLEQILAWADQFHADHGRWPRCQGESVAPAPGETWAGINSALRHGTRGLDPGTSLAQLLREHRGPDAPKGSRG